MSLAFFKKDDVAILGKTASTVLLNCCEARFRVRRTSLQSRASLLHEPLIAADLLAVSTHTRCIGLIGKPFAETTWGPVPLGHSSDTSFRRRFR
jgi:hypothetical protein